MYFCVLTQRLYHKIDPKRPEIIRPEDIILKSLKIKEFISGWKNIPKYRGLTKMDLTKMFFSHYLYNKWVEK